MSRCCAVVANVSAVAVYSVTLGNIYRILFSDHRMNNSNLEDEDYVEQFEGAPLVADDFVHQ